MFHFAVLGGANKEGRDYTGDCESMKTQWAKRHRNKHSTNKYSKIKLNGFIQSDCISGTPEYSTVLVKENDQAISSLFSGVQRKAVKRAVIMW